MKRARPSKKVLASVLESNHGRRKQGNLRKMSDDLCHSDRPRTAGLHQFSNSSITEES